MDNDYLMNHIEIELTSVCDMKCKFCDRFMQYSHDKNMTIYQISEFIRESLEMNYPWDRIHVLGGEPTLHPDFLEIMDLLINYRNKTGLKILRVITNNHGKIEKYRDYLLDNNVDIYSDYKTENIPYYFSNTLRCQLDNNDGLHPPCGIFGVKGCGVGFTRYGYFLCGAGASIARLCGYDIGFKSLKEVTYNNLYKQADYVCNKCGHTVDYFVRAYEDEKIGPFWEKQLQIYNEKKPELNTIYEH
jgi:hypothetical protein